MKYLLLPALLCLAHNLHFLLLLAFHLQTRRTRKTSWLVALYPQTNKREGRPVSEAVNHFVYWHDGRSCSVSQATLIGVQFGLASSREIVSVSTKYRRVMGTRVLVYSNSESNNG
jgi:hypothetical protein